MNYSILSCGVYNEKGTEDKLGHSFVASHIIPSNLFRQICPVRPIYSVISYPLICRKGKKKKMDVTGELGHQVLEIIRHNDHVSDWI